MLNFQTSHREYAKTDRFTKPAKVIHPDDLDNAFRPSLLRDAVDAIAVLGDLSNTEAARLAGQIMDQSTRMAKEAA